MVTVNLADSVRWQDNINKGVSREKENVIYCLRIEWQIFPFADKINKLAKKDR